MYNNWVPYSSIPREDHSGPLSASLGVIDFSGLPFAPKRAYWISNFVPETIRGNHAHKSLNQIMIMVSGSLELTLFQGNQKESFFLTQKSDYLLIPPKTWRIMSNASQNASLLVLVDSKFDEQDYIRDWNTYLEWFYEDSTKS